MSTPINAKLVCVALAAFALLHQDSWLWNDSRLVLGFLPSGLAYHAAFSLATAALWAVAGRYAWPRDLAGAESASEPAGETTK